MSDDRYTDSQSSLHQCDVAAANVDEHVAHVIVEYHVYSILTLDRSVRVAKLAGHHTLGRDDWGEQLYYCVWAELVPVIGLVLNR